MRKRKNLYYTCSLARAHIFSEIENSSCEDFSFNFISALLAKGNLIMPRRREVCFIEISLQF